MIGRRGFVAGACAIAMLGPHARLLANGGDMYGLIGKIVAKPGERDALLAALMDGSEAMPGCLSYIVAKDTADADAIWVTEVWHSQASHKASLQLPAVRAAIQRGRPLIAGFESVAITEPRGGVGLRPAASAG